MAYAIHNGDLGNLLEDGKPRPKLRLILRAKAKLPRSPFVDNFVTLYRQLDEGVQLSPATEAALEKIASGPRHQRWSTGNRFGR